mgnify:CR=1 FL=1
MQVVRLPGRIDPCVSAKKRSQSIDKAILITSEFFVMSDSVKKGGNLLKFRCDPANGGPKGDSARAKRVPIWQYWLPVFIYAALIFYFSSIPRSQLPSDMPFPDYVLHFVEYLPFGFLLARSFKNTKKDITVKKVIMYSCIAVFVYALSDEFHQLFVPGRNFSMFDILSDSIGAFIGMRLLR